jgi:hypothetical protein
MDNAMNNNSDLVCPPAARSLRCSFVNVIPH